MKSLLIKHLCILTALLMLTAIMACGSGRTDDGGNGSQKTQTQLPVETLSLSTDKTSVQTDTSVNSTGATITAQVKSPNNVGVENATVEFSANAGLLSKSKVRTDSNGNARVKFNSGSSDASNQVATITASVSGTDNKQIPIKLTGSEMILTPTDTNIEIEKDKSELLTVKVQDASNVEINGATVSVKVVDGETNILLSNSKSSGNSIKGKTGPTGETEFNINGTAAGESSVQIEALNLTHTKKIKVTPKDLALEITNPSESPASLQRKETLNIKASIPPGTEDVMFSTSLGEWVKTAKSTREATNSADKEWTAVAEYNATQVGTATIEVYDKDNIQKKDSLQIINSAPSDQAGEVNLQLSNSNVQPSTGDVENTVELTAYVRTLGGAPVKDAPVVFTLDNSTGSGESISPSTVYTDSSGQAKASFNSGSRSSGAEGVTVSTEVLIDNPPSGVSPNQLKDSKSIVISGEAGSISIGSSTKIYSIQDDTAYRLPMSVLVTDSNGNAVEGAEVSLSPWPVKFATGIWEKPEDEDSYVPNHNATFPNEDENRNLILDDGEDHPNKNYIDDGVLTPSQAAGGSLPGTVTTNENGVANFDLIYTKEVAGWVQTEIKASTQVLGTESISTLNFWLRYLIEDAKEPLLPPSPFNPK